jgi:cytochrome c oxidase cbb3-type subunit 2
MPEILRTLRVGLWVLAAGVSALTPGTAGEGEQRDDLLRHGQQVYQANCAFCHGAGGDGQGMMGHMMRTQPRDFSRGTFKFRSTPTGSLPRDEDLFRTVGEGLRGTAMIGQGDLPEPDRWAVVQYVKSLSPRFRQELPGPPVPIPPAPPRTEEQATAGKELYRDAECWKCHGEGGRGDGPSAERLRDEWGFPALPADLTRRPLKRANAPEDLYRVLVTGLDGTPMPSYREALAPGEVWALVYYLESLVTKVFPADVAIGDEGMGRMALRMHRGGGGMGGQAPPVRP